MFSRCERLFRRPRKKVKMIWKFNTLSGISNKMWTKDSNCEGACSFFLFPWRDFVEFYAENKEKIAIYSIYKIKNFFCTKCKMFIIYLIYPWLIKKFVVLLALTKWRALIKPLVLSILAFGILFHYVFCISGVRHSVSMKDF